MLQEETKFELNLQFFAKDGPGGEKTEEPTQKKLEDARKEGQVAKSKEIYNAFGLLGLFLIINFYAGYMGNNIMGFFAALYNRIPDLVLMPDGFLPTLTFRNIFIEMLLRVVILVGPIMALACVIAIVCNVAQVKWNPTAKPLKPKFSKLNPIKGFGKIFSKNSLVELLKSIAKIGIIAYVAYSYLLGRIDELFLLYDIPIMQAIGLTGDIVVQTGIRIAAAYLVIAFADLIYQKHKHRKDNMMTKQEVKDEFKNQEGDPQVKGQQKRRMMQASQRRMMQQLPEADVVITNPTHYAVAIKYDEEKYNAPIVLAKGADFVAFKIKELAKEHGVQIVENKPLARMLYTNVEVGELVPPELYQAVAEVLAMVYHMKGTA
ncbi:MAG: flagellar biosynthesis protein FlhB [Lachnospiraceae bacterium]|nr:flagellar biosynthesis protein FlhB [Lachnospiraceae bacterium]